MLFPWTSRLFSKKCSGKIRSPGSASAGTRPKNQFIAIPNFRRVEFSAFSKTGHASSLQELARGEGSYLCVSAAPFCTEGPKSQSSQHRSIAEACHTPAMRPLPSLLSGSNLELGESSAGWMLAYFLAV